MARAQRAYAATRSLGNQQLDAIGEGALQAIGEASIEELREAILLKRWTSAVAAQVRGPSSVR